MKPHKRFEAWAGTGAWVGPGLGVIGTIVWPIVDREEHPDATIDGYPELRQWMAVAFTPRDQMRIVRALNALQQEDEGR